jgi:putative flippase GtrA
MASVYYDLNVSADGGLTWAASSAAPSPMPADADSFLTSLRGVFDRIRLHAPEGPLRTAYANYALAVGRTGLQDGNLATATEELDALNRIGLNVQYYAVGLDKDDNLQLKAPPWAPVPIPEDAVTLSFRVDRTISKVKRLIATKEQEHKLSQYLRMLISYARKGLEEGDIKGANSALDSFEAEFVDEEGPAFRSAYVSSTLWTALYTFFGALLLGILYKAVTSHWPDYASYFKVDDNFIPTVLAVVIGICLGISFFAFVRNLSLTFASLGHFDPANLSSVLRFSLVGIIALILCIVLQAGLLKLEVAGLKLEEFMQHRLTAIILGMVCGYSDAAITKTLTGLLDVKG